MLTSFSYFDLIETFPEGGCAICHLIGHDADRQLDALLGEFAVDVETHRQLRASRGLCNDHAWRLMEHGEAYKVALLYNSVLDETVRRMQTGKKWFSRSPLEPDAPCVVCAVMDKSETVYLKTLSEQFGNPKLQNAFRQSDGLCLPHFRKLIMVTTHSDHAAMMIDIQRGIWQRLQGELELFMQQLSMPGIDPHMGEERDSWKRTIARMSGEKGIFGRRW
jgi:hypothetical protein